MPLMTSLITLHDFGDDCLSAIRRESKCEGDVMCIHFSALAKPRKLLFDLHSGN